MRALKKRQRPDNIPNEKRVARGRAGRYVYLTFLAIFALMVTNYFFGEYFLLRADGLVLRDEHVVAPTYIARVSGVDVEEGQPVEAGQTLLTLQSSEILERLADLSTKRAALVADATNLKIKAESVAQLLPLAERREAEAQLAIKQFEDLANGKYVTSVRYEEALRANYDASRERVILLTQRDVLSEELTALDRARADADDAIAKLKSLYADGVMRSPVSGAIGASIPAVGNVYRPGDPMLSIYSGTPYVLVFMPRRYLFSLSVGMTVEVTDGREVAQGVVDEILPVTEALPKEFQNTFKPTDRNQLAKIKFTSPSPFPLHQKVTVTRHTLLEDLLEAPALLDSGSQAAPEQPGA